MRYFLDLFAGIGGFALGAEWASVEFDKHYFSEVDDYAIKVYNKRFPDAIALGDITKIDGNALPAGDWIIAGGFPCQDISVAGKGAGLDGKRSGLWFEYARLIGELRPRFAIMENVGALTHRGLDRVLGSLAEIWYDAEWQDIRASDVGAPHKRERIWIVAYPSGSRSWSESGAACTDRGRGTGRDEQALRQAYGENGADRIEPTSQAAGNVADARSLSRIERYNTDMLRRREKETEQTGMGGCNMADSDKTQRARDGGADPTEKEHAATGRPGSRSEWWATEPDVGRVAHGVSSRVDRLKCLGNSIVPQIAMMIFQHIKGLL